MRGLSPNMLFTSEDQAFRTRGCASCTGPQPPRGGWIPFGRSYVRTSSNCTRDTDEAPSNSEVVPVSAISALSWHRSGRGPPPSFTPPRLSRPFTFTRPQLIGSFARAAALSHSSPAVLQGLTQAFDELLKTLVDPGPTELTFRTDVESLSDNLRVAFSGFLGAAIADLLMMQLGYAFRCNGRELLKQGRIFDLAYDSGSLVAGDIVAVEAKGRLRSTATPALVRLATVQGYD